MAAQNGSRVESARPKPRLIRSHSSVEPSKRPHPSLDFSVGQMVDGSPPPAPPVDTKPRSSRTAPCETPSSKFHIPRASGLRRSDPDSRSSSRHRHTQSDLSGHRFGPHRRAKNDALPHLAAGIAKERGRRSEQGKLPHAFRNIRGDGLRRIVSNESDEAPAGRPATPVASSLRGISSDPKMYARQVERARVEMLLETADAQKLARRAAVSQKDVDKIREANVQGEENLKRRLVAINKTSVELMRRLDYTYYDLLETMGNLVTTVQSLRSFTSQTEAMVDNFSQEISLLESEVKSKAETLSTSFDQRQDRVHDLEERGERAHARARDLSARLDQARLKVMEWEEKERAERRRRTRFWRTTWTCLAVVFLLIFFASNWREWRLRAELARVALADETLRSWSANQTQPLDDKIVSGDKETDEVESVANGVVERPSRSADISLQKRPPSATARLDLDDDWLKMLDNL